MKKSIIGELYIPNDTSYCVNLSYPQRDVRLAGSNSGNNLSTNPLETKIVSEPYKFIIIHCRGEEGTEYNFINVEYKGDIFRVLFHEQNINANLAERIKHQKELLSMLIC